MIDPVSGSIKLNGRDITTVSQRELRPFRRTMQMIYQDPYESLDPRFRVSQLVAEPLLIHGKYRDRADRPRRVFDALERAELTRELFVDRHPELGRPAPAVAAPRVWCSTGAVADERSRCSMSSAPGSCC
jgi:ABC-type microcin C transport system duplicated ATPase subunit YejF